MRLTPESALRKDRDVKSARFQHAHFTVIADLLRALPDNVDGITPGTAKAITRYFARNFARQYPNFVTDRFIRAVEE